MKEEKRSFLHFICSMGAQISVSELKKFGSDAHCPSSIAVQIILVAAFCPLACGCDRQFAGSCSAVPVATHLSLLLSLTFSFFSSMKAKVVHAYAVSTKTG